MNQRFKQYKDRGNITKSIEIINQLNVQNLVPSDQSYRNSWSKLSQKIKKFGKVSVKNVQESQKSVHFFCETLSDRRAPFGGEPTAPNSQHC